MADGIEKIPLIEREIKCLADFKADMTNKFENRKPAELTYEFINKTNLAMQQQTDDLKNLTKTLDTHVQDQKTHEAKLQVSLESYQSEIFKQIGNVQGAIDKWIEESNRKSEEESIENDKKYAPKAVYKVLLWAGGIIGAVLLVAAVRLIYQVIVFFVDK